ncbi:MAG: hypothetical protein NVSMB17_18650 [Candidatus Dormibacteria bacterium]
MGPPPGSPPPGAPPSFQPPAFPPQPGYGAVAATATNQKAVISLVLSLVGAVCCLGLITGPLAIYFGNAAQKEIATSGGAQGGSGIAKAGLIIGIIELVLAVLFILAIVGGVLSGFRSATAP